MNNTDYWVLPEGIEEKLPASARHIEYLRRKALDLFSVWGYDLIITPLVEYLESLIIDGDESLNLQTLKLTDVINGKVMGVRADMTPQVARIDAHRLASGGIERLCYAGTVLRANPNFRGTRSLLQIGAEMYGHSGIGGSSEVIRLMAATLDAVGIQNIHIDIGHVGIYSALVKAAGLTSDQEKRLAELIRIKAAHEIQDYLQAINIKPQHITWFTNLIELYGDTQVLNSAKQILKGTDAEVPLAELELVFQNLTAFGIQAKCDLAELGSYYYETGLVFSVFVEDLGQEIVHGGRYDNIGEIFGRARPAVGFSSDLLLLASLVDDMLPMVEKVIYAPYSVGNPDLQAKIAALREQGTRVIEQASDETEFQIPENAETLGYENGSWVIR